MTDYEKFKQRREELNLSMRDIADMCGGIISRQAVYRFEHGEKVLAQTKAMLMKCLFKEPTDLNAEYLKENLEQLKMIIREGSEIEALVFIDDLIKEL